MVTFFLYLGYLFKPHMAKNLKPFCKKLDFRTHRQPSYLNNGLHDTHSLQAKSQQDEKRAFSLSQISWPLLF